jgi:hypothetical protein
LELTWLKYTWHQKKYVIEKLSSPSSKENGNIVISKEAVDNCLETINLGLFWTSLSMVRLSADCYCGTHSLQWPFSLKRSWLLHQSIVHLHENARCHTPNWTAVTSDKLRITPNLVLSGWSLTEILGNHLGGKWLQ